MRANATRRAALVWIGAFPAAAAVASHAQASPAPISTVHWDRALEVYLEAREAQGNDLSHGELRRAYGYHEALPDDAPVAEIQKMFDAEEAHHQRFSVPREKALQALLATAAPTSLALRQKAWIALNEQVAEVGADGRPVLSVIADDLTRLAGKGVGRG